MTTNNVRVRFAPSPTGFMHLGNVRCSLLNYLFATHHNGTFILRIEDTDTQRNVETGQKKIIEDLHWLNLHYSEGPIVGGNYGPYCQSERALLYKEHLDKLIALNKVYRCFCTVQDLENKRQRQIALKKPPRYDKICLRLTQEQITKKITEKTPHIWRFAIDETKQITIQDLAHGSINFEMKNFSDFPLSREDGSFTFLFANFVDDLLMNITHVIRGEDHLSNTANQAVMYDAFNKPLPLFWHLPIVCNKEGKKLSKRDFGFSLDDLMHAGFLPEAITNYLALIGNSFTEEIQDLEQLAKNYNFESMKPTGAICYDVEKLTWLNHKWILRLSTKNLTERIQPLLKAAYPQIQQLTTTQIESLVEKTKNNIKLLPDAVTALRCYFVTPTPQKAVLEERYAEKLSLILPVIQKLITHQELNFDIAKALAKEHTISTKELFSFIRYATTESFEGLGIHELVDLLGTEEVKNRIKTCLTLF